MPVIKASSVDWNTWAWRLRRKSNTLWERICSHEKPADCDADGDSDGDSDGDGDGDGGEGEHPDTSDPDDDDDNNDGENDCEGCSLGGYGIYEPEYPDGFDSIMSSHQSSLDSSSFMNYINSWDFTVSGYAPSLYDFCFDLGIINLGCHAINIDERVYPFIRIVMLISCLFLCRQITVGA